LRYPSPPAAATPITRPATAGTTQPIPPASQGGNDTPSGNNGGNSNINVSDDNTPVLDAIGKTEEGKRMVKDCDDHHKRDKQRPR
jgi:hypothetical protein